MTNKRVRTHCIVYGDWVMHEWDRYVTCLHIYSEGKLLAVLHNFWIETH